MNKTQPRFEQYEMICRYKGNGILTFVNSSYAEAFGKRPDELIGTSFLNLVPEENRDELSTYIRGIQKGTIVPVSKEYKVLTKEGGLQWHEWINVPLKNEKGEIVEVQGIGRNISYRKKLEAEQSLFDKIVKESYNEIYVFDFHSLQFQFANASALKNIGFTLEELVSRKLSDLFSYPDLMALEALLNPLRRGDSEKLQLQIRHCRKNGSYYDVDMMIQVLEKDRSFVAIVSDITDKLITERKLLDTIREKETLIKEIHHRVKNNLQLISSIIYLKIASLNQSEIKSFLEDTRQKIKSIALIHERLLQSEQLHKVEISDYLGKLIQDLQITNGRPDLDLQFETDVQNGVLSIDTAIMCGLIVNELVTNSIKHAFRGRNAGKISVSMKCDEIKQKYFLEVADNGISLPSHVVPGMSDSFGMQLLDVFIKQLGGSCEIMRENGTKFQIHF